MFFRVTAGISLGLVLIGNLPAVDLNRLAPPLAAEVEDDAHAPPARPTSAARSKERALVQEITPPEIAFQLSPNRSKLFRSKLPLRRLSVSDSRVLEVVQYSPLEFELIGHQAGTSTLTLWFSSPKNEPQILRAGVRVAPGK